jgi:hypothetical protein
MIRWELGKGRLIHAPAVAEIASDRPACPDGADPCTDRGVLGRRHGCLRSPLVSCYLPRQRGCVFRPNRSNGSTWRACWLLFRLQPSPYRHAPRHAADRGCMALCSIRARGLVGNTRGPVRVSKWIAGASESASAIDVNLSAIGRQSITPQSMRSVPCPSVMRAQACMALLSRSFP